MDHDKIEAVLKKLDRPEVLSSMTLEEAADLIRDLRTEIGNQETKIVDLEEAVKANPIEVIDALIVDSISTQISEGDGFWRSCSGCHELNEGRDTGPYSETFKCTVGGGCRECGGIGAVWDATDYESLADSMMRDDETAADNAALIAAVPGLVEALGIARDYLNEGASSPSHLQVIDKIDAALASIGRKP